QLLDADRRRLAPRLQEPRPGDGGQEVADVVVVDDADELRDADAQLPAAGAHGQLVAEQAGGALAQAGQPQVLAEVGGDLDVEVVQGDDPADRAGAGQVADGVDDQPPVLEVGQGEHLVD